MSQQKLHSALLISKTIHPAAMGAPDIHHMEGRNTCYFSCTSV